MITTLDYITHRLTLEEKGSFTKITVLPKEPITCDWFEYIINSDYKYRYVDGERLLMFNFLRSLFSEPIISGNDISISQEFDIFPDEGRYYIYTVRNDLEFSEQEWFKTAYSKHNILFSTALAINKSTQLVGKLYPDTIHLPDNSIDKIFDAIKGESVFRNDFYEVEKILKDNGIDRFFHSTSTNNLPSIKRSGGLLSLSELKKRNISIQFASSETSRHIDKTKGAADYVHLSYEPDYPMMKKAINNGSIASITQFIISPVVALLKDTMFTKMNMVTTGEMPSKDINVIKHIPFHRFHKHNYWTLSEEDRKFYMAEILVKNKIPCHAILNWELK